MRIVGLKTLCLILFFLYSTLSYASQKWPLWETFKRYYISPEGRVVDPQSPQKKTTTEGQSYALFFALVADDKHTFQKLLYWTEKNLASGNLGTHLPAWEKGQNQQKKLIILDPNSASDADLWIAYDLIEAGRIWNNTHYSVLGKNLLHQILKQEVFNIQGLGYMVLPGKLGFRFSNYWRLNPSYLPPQLMARFAALSPAWKELEHNSWRLLLDTSSKGFAPDWVIWKKNEGWKPDPKSPNVGGYDAIRVYLWVGMLADEAAQKHTLVDHFSSIISLTQQLGGPPEKINTFNGEAQGKGPIGFVAALLPLFKNNAQELDKLRQRLASEPLDAHSYYNSVLRLFGEGWDQNRYRFGAQGELLR
jgi:endoglucanase